MIKMIIRIHRDDLCVCEFIKEKTYGYGGSGDFVPAAAVCLNRHKNFTKNIAKSIDIAAHRWYIILVISTRTQ